MTSMPGGTLACPENDHPTSIPPLVADMVPGAVRLRVSLSHPQATWPHPYCRAHTATGETVPLSRTAARTLARWVIRSHPDVDWAIAHDLDLATGVLAPSARRGR
jgi:hypothetical protein